VIALTGDEAEVFWEGITASRDDARRPVEGVLVARTNGGFDRGLMFVTPI
jgi:hypothetical protein